MNVPLPAHLSDGDVLVPVGDRTFARIGLLRDLGQAVGRRNDDRRADPIDVEARVVLARPPRLVDRAGSRPRFPARPR